ncbi:MAG TPA: condensation domain-containing protein, partial [Thermoanaerobaculia bacterium]|nr:condensation domain-containing protein [Thermoanaerobaculia bacterium]
IWEVFGVELSMRVLFEVSTLTGLAAEIQKRQKSEGAQERPTIASFSQDRSSPPPLTFAQERFWLRWPLEARTVPFTIQMMLRLEGPLDPVSLYRALQEVVDRHEALRTSFREDSGRAVQVVHPAAPILFPIVDLERVAPGDRMEEIRLWSLFGGRLHFDLLRGPVFRLTLFRCSESESVLLFVVHHIAFDGWSGSVLLGELSALYSAFREGRPSPLKPLAFQHQDFARWQRQALGGESLARLVNFWREHLREARPFGLGGDLPRSGHRASEAGIESFLVPEEIASRLEGLAAERGVTLFMVLFAAFNALLHHETGQDDIVILCMLANRNLVEVENLIANFSTALPLRTRLSGARTFRELLERVRDMTLAAYEHPERIHDLKEGDGLQAFRVTFQLDRLPPAEHPWSGLDVSRLPIDSGRIQKDLNFALSQSDRLAGRFRYNRDVLDPDRVVLLRDRFLRILAAVVADPDCPLAELPPAGAPAGCVIKERLAGIFAEVLGVERVEAHDGFFELGVHSLLAIQVMSRIRDIFGVELALRVFFEARTLAGLAAWIEGQGHQDGAAQRPLIASFRQDRSGPPPLSFAQERSWAGRQSEARTVASTIPMLLQLEGRLDPECLRRALQEIVDRHEVLRTSFKEEAEGPVQVVHPTVPVRLPVVDLEQAAPHDRLAEIRRWSTLDGRSHFDYERGPLFRLTLFRCSERESVLLFTVHHVAFDGWSQSVLSSELSILYGAFRRGRPSPLPPLAAQYQDFARWQRQTLAGETLARQMAFWREHLQGAVPLDLCGGRPRPARRTFEAGIEAFAVPEELERRLDAFAAEHCVTLFMMLLTAFEALLHQETGGDDLVVTCLFANRNQFEIESLIGNFYAGLPLRTRLSGARTFRDLLERVRDVTLAAHEHPDILYEPVMEGMSFLENGDRGGLATFRILFQLTKLPAAEPALCDVKAVHLPFDTGKIRQDLSLFLTQSDRLAGRFKYNRDILDQERVVRMRERFLRILAAAVLDPDRPLAEC